jgi:hypothetical protein
MYCTIKHCFCRYVDEEDGECNAPDGCIKEESD